MAEEYLGTKKKLTKDERQIVRACSSCEGEMTTTEHVVENSVFIFKDSGTRFQCQECDEAAIILSYPAMFMKVVTFLMSAGIAAMIVYNRYWELAAEMFNESIGFAALGIVVSLIALILIFGGLINLVGAIKDIRGRAKYPVVSGGSGWRTLLLFVITMLYGLVPWVILGGLGFLNDTVLNIDRDWAIVLVAPGLSPIFLAPFVGISIQGAFFATASYPAMGLIFYFFS